MDIKQLKSLANSYNCTITKRSIPYEGNWYEGNWYEFVLKCDDEDEADDFFNDDRLNISSVIKDIEKTVVTFYFNTHQFDCSNCGQLDYGKEEYHRCK